MITIHIFNPEHDIALAANLSNFTPPHAGRQLRSDLGFLPALWAENGDAVLVDDAGRAEQRYKRLVQSLNRQMGRRFYAADVAFVGLKQLNKIGQIDAVNPWGWNVAQKAQLKRSGVAEALLPTDTQLAEIRELSHRRTSARLLPLLQQEGTVGEAYECFTEGDVTTLLGRYDRMVLKAPWSSSGRGLRFVTLDTFTPQVKGWLRHLLEAQGSVMAEPFYDKEKDFGMEFFVTETGEIRYDGLSLFHTANGAYTGNILATESLKREMISRYLSLNLLDTVKEKVKQELKTVFKDKYVGPFGIDMMIVKGEKFGLHPCVEINLRRTMGHVALSLSPTDDDVVRVMRIEYNEGQYRMKIERVKKR
jgi:hypothetical protein